MPTSMWESVPIAVKIINVLKPRTVLDIGIGSGKWGFIARELLDIRNGRFQKDEFQAIIDGIEIFPKYISDYHKGIYNNIFIGNAAEVVNQLGNYELAIIGDCLEHFKREEAASFIKLLHNKCIAILIILPIGHSPQDACHGNPYEEHLDSYDKNFFKEYSPFIKILYKKGKPKGIILIHHDKQIIRKLKKKFGTLEIIKSLKKRLLRKGSL
jgi:hypothetical protein